MQPFWVLLINFGLKIMRTSEFVIVLPLLKKGSSDDNVDKLG